MLTTRRYLALAQRVLWMSSAIGHLRALATSQIGCVSIVYSSMLARLSCSACHATPMSSAAIGQNLQWPHCTLYHSEQPWNLSMQLQIQKIVMRLLAVLRQLWSVRRSVPAWFTRRVSLRWCCRGAITLAGISAYHYSQLQSVMNVATRSVAGSPHLNHIIDTLASFHWLRAPERVQFKLAVLAFCSLHSLAPCYLSDVPFRLGLQSASTSRLDNHTHSTQINVWLHLRHCWCKAVELSAWWHYQLPVALDLLLEA